jgi:hypothetical protein
VNASLSATSAGPFGGGDTVVVAVSIGDGISFNSLDAQLGWDPNVLVPLNLVVGSASPFLTLSQPPAGVFPSSFVAGTYDAAPGSSSIYVVVQSDPDPAVLANAPGELFRLAFQVKPGVVLPPATLINFIALDSPGGTFNGKGLAVTQLFDQNGDLLLDGNGDFAPLIYATTPQSLRISLITQSAPEPATFWLLLAGLGLSGRFVRRRLA